jgi:glycine/D-amino acid oxidase-like deaminating enzyme
VARFVIDAVPGRRRVFVAAGGSGHGFKFAPVMGELIAAVVLDVDHPRRSQTAWRESGAGPATSPARVPRRTTFAEALRPGVHFRSAPS